MAAEELAGFGIDGDEFAVAPDAGVLLVGYGEAVDGVAHGFEFVGWLRWETFFSRSRRSGRYWWWKRGASAACWMLRPLSMMLMMSLATVVMMVEPPGVPMTKASLPVVPVRGGRDDGWSHGGERALAWVDGVRRALDEAVHVGHADLGGEVVHLVVQQEAEAFDGYAASRSRR